MNLIFSFPQNENLHLFPQFPQYVSICSRFSNAPSIQSSTDSVMLGEGFRGFVDSGERALGWPLHRENLGAATAYLIDCFSVAAVVLSTQHLTFKGLLCSLIHHTFETKESK